MATEFYGVVDILRSGGGIGIRLDGGKGGIGLRDLAGRQAVRLVGGEASLYIGAQDLPGIIGLRDLAGRVAATLNGRTASLRLGTKNKPGSIVVRDGDERDVFRLYGGAATLRIGAQDKYGRIAVHDRAGREVIRLHGRTAYVAVGAEDSPGTIVVRDGAGNDRIRLDGNTGDIRLQGADCAEEFDVAELEKIDPGTVLVINEDGKLHPCENHYDKKVAGVVSGGNGSSPAIILDRRPTKNNRLSIALNGKTYCKVDAEYSPIEVGDLLTTSTTPGYAMKADDPLKAFGAVIGKALRPLRERKGLIPILVALQ